MNWWVTALGGISRELINHRNRLQLQLLTFREGTKGRFRKRLVLANVPSFQFLVPGNIHMYPRSGYCCWGTSECTLIPVFGTGEHPPKPPFWKPPFCETPNVGGICHVYIWHMRSRMSETLVMWRTIIARPAQCPKARAVVRLFLLAWHPPHSVRLGYTGYEPSRNKQKKRCSLSRDHGNTTDLLNRR